MKIGLFQACDHCWVFQICWHTECSTLTASYGKLDSPSFSSTQGFITSEKELQFFSQVLYIPESLAEEVDSYTSYCLKKKSSDHWGVNPPQFFQDCLNLRSLSYEPDLGMQDCTVPTITQVHLSRPYSACSSMPGFDTHHLNPPGHSCKEGIGNTLQISLNLESHTE